MPRADFHKSEGGGARGFLNIPTRAGPIDIPPPIQYNGSNIGWLWNIPPGKEGVALPRLKEYKNLHLLMLFFAFCGSFLLSGILRLTSFPFSLGYNLVMLALSALFLKADFHLNPFRPTAWLPRTLGRGALLALAMAAAIFLLGCLTRGVLLFPVRLWGHSVPILLQFFAIQVVVAFSEEALFRFYLYRCLLDTLRSRFWAALLCSLLFAGVHIALNGIWIQFFVALGVSLVFFAVLQKEPKNAYYLLVSAHFFYNLLVQLVFCV